MAAGQGRGRCGPRPSVRLLELQVTARSAALVALLLAGQAMAQTVVIYSRADSVQAHRAHALASALGPALIDRQMSPGVAWRHTIAAAICKADRVLLIWSERAAASSEVRREIDAALMCRVLIQPVLLDATPLPGLLSDINAVEWR